MAHDIIVIGASVGGVEALQTLVAVLPPDLEASLFIVVHRSASFPSMLPTLLCRAGPLLALHATENMVIEQRKIYIAPPDYHLLLEQGYMHLGTGPKEQYARPSVDVLFRSAAQAYESRVVAVILTGSGRDGASGSRIVKQHSGITVVQDPLDAAWPSMPQSTLEQGETDYTLPLLRIAPLLIHLVRLPS